MLKTTHTRKSPLRLGFVALTDSAPLVMAEELGLFHAHGLEVELHREIGWASIRDKVIYGELEAAQAPAGLLASATFGLGSMQAECLTGLVLSLHGNAITLAQSLWRDGVRDGATLRREIARGRRKFTFGVVHPFSSHNILLRTWLSSHEIEPCSDVRIVVVPPTQMHRNLKAGHLDGYCVGEPWNSVAVAAKTGWCVATSADLAPGHMEKVLMVRRDFSESFEGEHLALIAALLEACRFCEAPENREQVIETLARSRYVGASANTLRMSMAGSFDYGNGRIEEQLAMHVFAGGKANEPSANQAHWLIEGLRANGIIADPLPRARDCFRADIFKQAAELLPDALLTS